MASFIEKEPTGFVDGLIDDVLLTRLTPHVDDRGLLVELYRADELAPKMLPVMAYVSQTRPSVARGPHGHARQTDVFVFPGGGKWRVYLWDARVDSATYRRRQRIDVGSAEWVRVVVPPGVVHAYRNLGREPAWVFNGSNQLYAGDGRQSEVDEIRYEEQAKTPYRLD